MNHLILRSTPAIAELRVFNGGTLTDLDATPTVVFTDGNGDVVTTGAVSKPGAPNATGVYRSVIPGQANLQVLEAAWTGLFDGEPVVLHQDYEVVGNLLFTEAEARSAPIVGQQSALGDTTKYSDALIAHMRVVVGETMEQRMNRGVIRRYCRTRIGGSGRWLDLSYGRPSLSNGTPLNRPGRIWDISRVISATINGVAQTPADIEIVGYKLYHTTGSWSAGSSPLNVTVEYEYGPDPVWGEAYQRALDLLLANATPKGFASTATSISTEDGTFRIATFPTAVEEFFKEHKHRSGFGFA